MKIYAFNKSYLQRVSDYRDIIYDDDTLSIRDQWKYFMESAM